MDTQHPHFRDALRIKLNNQQKATELVFDRLGVYIESIAPIYEF